MKVKSRFIIAVHSLLCIYAFSGRMKVTSGLIAGSTGVNPVIIRQTLLTLKAAGIIRVQAGSGGAFPLQDASKVTLYDVYAASGSREETLFSFQETPNPNCPIGNHIHKVLDSRLCAAQSAFENELRKVTFAELLSEIPQS